MKRRGTARARVNDPLGSTHAPPRQAGLTPRQQQVLQLLSDGMSNKEIAHALGLTAGTVKQHLYALFRKLGVSNRTMAVVRSSRPKIDAGSDTARDLPPALRYARRLVTAVVLEPRAAPVDSPEAAHAQQADLRRLQETFAQRAGNFDATLEPLPGGGMTAWFGRRMAHGDDAARAIAFVRSFVAAGESGGLPCAIGLGTVPEVMGDGESESLAFRAFRVATVLASFAQDGEPLVCETTARVAGLALDGPCAEGVPVRARVLRAQRAPFADIAKAWGGLPFLDELETALRRGHCSWVAVESWPPDAGTRLLTAIGECLSARGFPVHRVWTPSPACADLGARIVDQLRSSMAFGGHLPTGETIDEIVTDLSSQGGAVLLAHGIDALAAMKGALKVATLDRLRALPLVVVGGVVPRSGAPQTAVRLLGAHPGANPFSRLLRMTVPEEVAGAIEGIRPDVQAVLDRVSPFARAVARAAAIAGRSDAESIASALGATRAAVLAGCEELKRAGLAEMDAELFRFRDEQTAGAVRATLVAQLR